ARRHSADPPAHDAGLSARTAGRPLVGLAALIPIPLAIARRLRPQEGVTGCRPARKHPAPVFQVARSTSSAKSPATGLHCVDEVSRVTDGDQSMPPHASPVTIRPRPSRGHPPTTNAQIQLIRTL